MSQSQIKYTTNPYDQTPVYEYQEHSDEEINRIIERCHSVSAYWAQVSFKERRYFLDELKTVMNKKKEILATTITKEMGKPLTQSLSEIEKCISLLNYYADLDIEHIDQLFAIPKTLHAKVELAPLGVVLAIMPWNFPFWQVFRCAIPALLGGNGIILKHASNVTYTATMISDCFNECGIPEDLFGLLICSSDKMENIIERKDIHAVSFTGSTEVGQKIAMSAAKGLKKTVLELGGMDPYIVLPDADLKHAAREIAKSRLNNSGQSCISAKRCFVHKDVEFYFLKELVNEFKAYNSSNPLCKETKIGPLAKEEIATKIRDYLNEDLEQGAHLLFEGDLENTKYRENFIAPSIVTQVRTSMNLMKSEVFAPILPVMSFQSIHQVITLANATPYGLGAAVFGSHDQNIAEIVSKLQVGGVGINTMIASHPAVPFGGIKASGHGRELGLIGALEFQNIKSLYYK